MATRKAKFAVAEVPLTKEEVTPQEVLQPTSRVRFISGPQLAAFWLAVGVGGLIAVVIIGVGIFWATHTPTAPPVTADPLHIEAFTQMTAAVADKATSIFDSVVVRALLPVFTTLLGYIFGSQTASQGRSA